MLVLLPPSEGKTVPAEGPALDLAALSGSSLDVHRRRVLAALVRVSRGRDAGHLLGVGATLLDEVRRNVTLRSAPTAPAREVYTGVLYAAAGLADLPDDASRARADRSVRTVSALWGAVGPSDPIPAYRLSMGTDLPGVGPLAPSWRAPLQRVLAPVAADHLVVDCRSAAYAAAWPVPSGGPGHVSVQAVREVAGRRSVVSHWAKHHRGLLVRHLLTRSGVEPGAPGDLLEAARETVGDGIAGVDLDEGPGGRHRLTLVLG